MSYSIGKKNLDTNFPLYVQKNKLVQSFDCNGVLIEVKGGCLEYDNVEAMVLYEYTKRLLAPVDRITQYAQSDNLINTVNSSLKISNRNKSFFDIFINETPDDTKKLKCKYIIRIVSSKRYRELDYLQFNELMFSIIFNARVKGIKEIGMYLFDHNERANSNSVRAVINQLYATKNDLTKVAFVNREHVNANLRKAVPILVDFYAQEHNKKTNEDDYMNDADDIQEEEEAAGKLSEPKFAIVMKNLRHSIAYWNILSQDVIERQNYMHCSPEHLSWSYRRKKIIETIPKLHADILCIQGIGGELSDIYFDGHLNETYLVDYQSNQGFSSAIFFNKRNYQLVKSTFFPLAPSDNNGAQQYAHLIMLQSILGSSQLNGEPERLLIVNTSLSSAPNHSDYRVEQTRHILKSLRQYTDKECHVILAGGFFDDELSPIHNYLVSGSEESKPLTCIREQSDYLWYSQKLTLVGSATYQSRGGMIPNAFFSSDHLPIVAVLES